MAAAARISLHIHKLVSKKGHWFLKKAKILPKLFESLVNIVTSFVWLRLYWLRLRRRKPLFYSAEAWATPQKAVLHYVFSMAVQWDRVVSQVRGHEFETLNVCLSHAASCQIIR